MLSARRRSFTSEPPYNRYVNAFLIEIRHFSHRFIGFDQYFWLSDEALAPIRRICYLLHARSTVRSNCQVFVDRQMSTFVGFHCICRKLNNNRQHFHYRSIFSRANETETQFVKIHNDGSKFVSSSYSERVMRVAKPNRHEASARGTNILLNFLSSFRSRFIFHLLFGAYLPTVCSSWPTETVCFISAHWWSRFMCL